MIRKLAAFAALALALAVVPFAAPANAAYAPKLPTNIRITFTKVITGDPLGVRFSVSASDGTSPAGTITYTIGRGEGAARGAQLVARVTPGSVNASGHPVGVTGPVVHPGTYIVSAHFSPSNTARYLPSSNVARTGVRGVAVTNPNDNGGLPNTGGPDLGWLIAGLVLAGAGAGAVTYSRRRAQAAA